jgi:hypothetical protein
VADLEFFVDPICPWCWITSRWAVEVAGQRQYDIEWRFISLKLINQARTEAWYTPEYRAGHAAGHQALRVLAAVRASHGNTAVGDVYRSLGTMLHTDGRRDEFRADPAALIAEALLAVGLPVALAARCDDTSLDELLQADTDLAFERTGKDVGTPIITFHPGTGSEASFFGPVIARIPRGQEAVRLWDAIEVIATTSGMAELKRSLRERPRFD